MLTSMRRSSSAKRLLLATIAFFGVSSASSFAQDSMFSDVSLALGGFVTISPVYEGSDDYKVSAFPVIYPTFGDDSGEPSRLSFRGIDDVRYSLFRQSGFEVGPIIGYRFGRDEDDADELEGLGNVGGGLVLGGFAQYGIGGAYADIAVTKQVSGLSDSGFTARFGAGYETAITSRLTAGIYTSATYASEDYMDQYFSVTALQSAGSVGNSNYPVFDADAGIKNVDVRGSLSFDATKKLNLRVTAGYSRLVGDAADSPISVSNDQFSGGLGLIYKF